MSNEWHEWVLSDCIFEQRQFTLLTFRNFIIHRTQIYISILFLTNKVFICNVFYRELQLYYCQFPQSQVFKRSMTNCKNRNIHHKENHSV